MMLVYPNSLYPEILKFYDMLSFSTKQTDPKIQLTGEQLAELKDNYAEKCVENMDIQTMEQICYEYIRDSIDGDTISEFAEHVESVYDKQTLNDLLSNIT